MEVIGVIDLAAGMAVHARGGRREAYTAVATSRGVPIGGDPVALAAVYRDAGVAQIYVADLDAIGGGALQHAALRRLAAAGLPLWVDAAVADPTRAGELLNLGAARVIAGLETLPSYDALGDVAAATGADRLVLSLDVREGVPLGPLGGHATTPAGIATRAVAAGAGMLIVLDLARVGAGGGANLRLVEQVRAAVPGAPIVAGGGVRDADDLAELARVGCGAALVATALHEGRVHGRRSR